MQISYVIIVLVLIVLILYYFAGNGSYHRVAQRSHPDFTHSTSITELDLVNSQLRQTVSRLAPREIAQRVRTFRKVRENQCREIFERIFAPRRFPTARPPFLVNPSTGRCLELDGYNEDLALAFEYNGYQHYEYPNCFHRTRREFEDQLRRDQLKIELCRKQGVRLVSIPHSEKDLEEFIRRALTSLGISAGS